MLTHDSCIVTDLTPSMLLHRASFTSGITCVRVQVAKLQLSSQCDDCSSRDTNLNNACTQLSHSSQQYSWDISQHFYDGSHSSLLYVNRMLLP